MKTVYIVSLFLCLLVSSHAETFLEAKARTQVKSSQDVFLSLKNTDFGRSVLNMLTLRFQSSQKLDRLLTVLAELQGQIQGQQSDDDAYYTSTKDQYSTIITEQGRIIGEATDNINNYQASAADKRGALAQKQSAVALLESERDGILAFLGTLRDTREREKAEFATRNDNTNLLLAGIAKTITLFKQQTENQEVNPNAVQEILTLLYQLDASLRASLADDGNAESSAQADYEVFVAGRNDRLTTIGNDLNTLNMEINQLQVEIHELEENIKSEQIRRGNAEDLKAQTEDLLKGLEERYANNTAVRGEQFKLLSQVRKALADNPEDVQRYLNAPQ